MDGPPRWINLWTVSARFLSPVRHLSLGYWIGDASMVPVGDVARVLGHGCGSRVGCVLVTAGDRRVALRTTGAC